MSWACVTAGLASAAAAVLLRDLEWLESISSDAGCLRVVAAMLVSLFGFRAR